GVRARCAGRAIEIGVAYPPCAQLLDPVPGPAVQLLQSAELDGLCRAGFGAGRLQPALKSVVAERALLRRALVLVDIDHAEGAGGHAIAAAVADVLLDDHGIELGAEQRAGRAGLQAGRRVAVLADVAHHQPATLVLPLGRAAAVDLLDEGDMAPGGGG